MQQHPAFMTEVDLKNGELPPLVEALQQLKYDPDENTPKGESGHDIPNFHEDTFDLI
jgi:hypothetical protein